MLVRNYGEKFGFCFVTKSVKSLAEYLSTKGFELKKESSNFFTLRKGNSLLEIRKTKSDYLVVIFSKEENRITNLLTVTSSLCKMLEPEDVNPNRVTEESGAWVHSDLWDSSMLGMGSVVSDVLVRYINNKKRTFYNLRYRDSYDIAMDILMDKFHKNENYFYGNMRMLNTLLAKTVDNYLITLNKNTERTTSLDMGVGRTEGRAMTVGDIIECPKTEREDQTIYRIEEETALQKLDELERTLISMLREGYKIPEIANKLNLTNGEFMRRANSIRL